MPYKGVSVIVSYVAWDTVNNVGKTGDGGNHTLRAVGDGTEFTPSAPTITEVDNTNLKGVYTAQLKSSENNYDFMTLGGVSSSTGIVIIPISWNNDLTGDPYGLIGAAGAGLSALPWNAAWDTSVQSDVLSQLNLAFTDASAVTANGLLDRVRTMGWMLRNKLVVTDASGNAILYKDDSISAAFTVNSWVTDDLTSTTRLKWQ